MQNTVLEELTAIECQALLAQHHVGRLAFVEADGRPLIIPLNYLVHDGTVVIRTAPGSKASVAADQTDVAFEVDGVEEQLRLGWSVVVRGRLQPVTDPEDLEQLRGTPLEAWAPGDRSHFVRLHAQETSGRRISLADIPSQWWG